MRQASQMMSGGAGAGAGFDPANMQSMMNNPSMKGFMNNPEMINTALNMIKDPKNKGMLDMMQQ